MAMRSPVTGPVPCTRSRTTREAPGAMTPSAQRHIIESVDEQVAPPASIESTVSALEGIERVSVTSPVGSGPRERTV